MKEIKKTSNNSHCKIDPIQLSLKGEFLVLIGYFILFISTLIEVQEQCERSEGCSQHNKKNAEKRINDLEREMYKLKQEVNYLDLNN